MFTIIGASCNQVGEVQDADEFAIKYGLNGNAINAYYNGTRMIQFCTLTFIATAIALGRCNDCQFCPKVLNCDTCACQSNCPNACLYPVKCSDCVMKPDCPAICTKRPATPQCPRSVKDIIKEVALHIIPCGQRQAFINMWDSTFNI